MNKNNVHGDRANNDERDERRLNFSQVNFRIFSSFAIAHFVVVPWCGEQNEMSLLWLEKKWGKCAEDLNIFRHFFLFIFKVFWRTVNEMKNKVTNSKLINVRQKRDIISSVSSALFQTGSATQETNLSLLIILYWI